MRQAVRALPSERVALDLAVGRVLAEPVVADRDLPPADRSAMDGYACCASDTITPTPLRVLGAIAAGHPALIHVLPGTCVRIFTGGVVPPGADCVAMQEVVAQHEDGNVTVQVAQLPGQNVLAQGEDARAGATLLDIGTRIGPAQMGVLASVGMATPLVVRRPRVALFATGTELQAIDATAADYQLRESNTAMVAALLRVVGGAEVTVAPPILDQPEALAAHLQRVIGEADVVISTGGASVGPLDLMRASFATLPGATLHFDKLLMKPGKPVLFATLPEGPLLFGLPGSPLACLTAARVIVLPAIREMAGLDPLGPQLPVQLATALDDKPGRTRYVLASLRVNATTGVIEATPVATHSVADLVAAGHAHGLLEIGSQARNLEAGTMVSCLLLHRWPE